MATHRQEFSIRRHLTIWWKFWIVSISLLLILVTIIVHLSIEASGKVIISPTCDYKTGMILPTAFPKPTVTTKPTVTSKPTVTVTPTKTPSKTPTPSKSPRSSFRPSTPSPSQNHGTVKPLPLSSAIIDIASDHIGIPYVWGGTTHAGFDCSGFVQHVFRSVGIPLPRTAQEQCYSSRVIRIAKNLRQPGDILCFNNYSGYVSHVSIYAGNDRMIAASAAYGRVIYQIVYTTQYFVVRPH